MQMLHLDSRGLCKRGAHFPRGVQIDPSEAGGKFKCTKMVTRKMPVRFCIVLFRIRLLFFR